MSRRARTRRDKRAPQPDFDDDTTAAYGRTRLDRFYGSINARQRPILPAHRGGPCRHDQAMSE